MMEQGGHMPLTWNISHDKRLVMISRMGALLHDPIETFLAAARSENALRYWKLFDARNGYSALMESQFTSYLGIVWAIPAYRPWALTPPSSGRTEVTPRRLLCVC
jgi:hypothetical protein